MNGYIGTGTAGAVHTNLSITFPISELNYALSLEYDFKECVECEEQHIHDENDYLCWTCRGKPYIERPMSYSTNGTTNPTIFVTTNG